MKAGEILINGIFNGSRLLKVPFFQRSYVWDEPQWERFLQDMELVTKTKRQYFLGPIILKGDETPPTWACYSDCKTIIDGQQRLTTLAIFLKVLCLKQDTNDLFNRDFRLEDGSIALRHGKNDIEAFNKVIDQKEPKEIANIQPESQIISAYNYFVRNVDPSSVDRMILKKCVQFVCIDLLEDEDEQQVFDTINSQGVRLTTAELLKNYFYREENIAEYERDWVGVFENSVDDRVYWDQELETGRIKRSLIDIFFDAYFQLFIQNRKYNVPADRKLEFSRIDQMAKSYQAFIRDFCAGDKNAILGPMAEYAHCFAQTFRPEICNMGLPPTPGMERLNVIIFGLKNTTLIPYILYVAKNVEDEGEKSRIYAILESYIMKRMVVHATTKNYNRVFESLILNEVLDGDTLLARLAKDDDVTTYVPGEEELLRGFQESKLVNLQTRGILYLIESGVRPADSATALLGFNAYSLEHLMPKKWRNNWQPCESTELARARDSKLLTLGNLAIIPLSLNASIRDANWTTKLSGKGNKAGLSVCAGGLATVHDVLKKTTWDEMEIDARAQWLFERAVEIWKY